MGGIISFIIIGIIVLVIAIFALQYLLIMMGVVEGPKAAEDNTYKKVEKEREYYKQDLEIQRTQHQQNEHKKQ